MNKYESIAVTDVSRSKWHNILLSCGLIGPVMFWITSFLFGIATENYDYIGQSVSDLEFVAHGWIQSVNFIVYGVLSCVFAIGLRKELASGAGALSLPILFALNGAGLILSGIIIHDPIHHVSRMLSLVTLIVSFFLFARRFAADPKWKGWSAYALMNAFVIIILVISSYSLNSSGIWTGIIERLIIFIRTFWSVIFTIRLLIAAKLTPADRGINLHPSTVTL